MMLSYFILKCLGTLVLFSSGVWAQQNAADLGSSANAANAAQSQNSMTVQNNPTNLSKMF